jgi:hypothetical protein
MTRVALILALILVGFMPEAFAWPRHKQTYSSSPNVSAYNATNTGNTGSAQGVAEMQARSGQCRHFGGNSGYEGVGFSTISADAAIRNCCFWGQRAPVDIGVARGPRGWFACVRYR